LGGNISEYSVGSLAWRLDHVALDARDETVDGKVTYRRIQQVERALDAGADMIMVESDEGSPRYARI